MQFIDTHIHLQDFNKDCALEILENPDVLKLFLISAKRVDWDAIDCLIKQYPNKLVGVFGLHPWYCDEVDDLLIDDLRKFLLAHPSAMVGEIGVDELRTPVTDGQHVAFSKQIAIAKELNRQVIIHGAKAFEALKLHKDELSGIKFSHHGFVKNRELIKFVNDCGGYFGISALFLKQEHARDYWNMMPKDKVLFETDAPFRVPEEGYLNTYEKNMLKLAEIVDINVGELEDLLKRNAMEFLYVRK